MIIGIGTDLTPVDRIAKILARHGDRFITRCFAPEEHRYKAQDPQAPAHYAKRFAAKEAAAKALGTGIRNGLSLKDLIITNDENGAPTLHFRNRAIDFAHKKSKGIAVCPHLSLSDDVGVALAFVVLETTSP